MKIALLICGTTRNYKENYATWKKHLLDLYNVSIFFHTYDVDGYHLNNINNFNKNDLLELLKPKKYLIESFDDKNNDFKKQTKTQFLRRGSPKPESIKSQLYSIYMVNQLKKLDEKENNYIYDIVIKIRFDTMFYGDFSVDDINLIKLHDNVILCGNNNIKIMLYKNACINCINNFNNNNFVKCDTHSNVSDIVIISNSKNMNHYAKIYFRYDIFIKEYYNMALLKYSISDLVKYAKCVYDNGSIMYYDVPNILYLYPEKVLALHLENYILLNYTLLLDTNRKII